MTHRTYIVVLKEGVDYNTVWQEIESATTGLSHVPDRPVTIVNERRMFKRICEYELTDAEADNLKNDSRVESVEIPVRDLANVEAVNDTVQNAFQLRMTYSKPPGNATLGTPPLYSPYPLNAAINWGLIRHTNRNNPYGINLFGFTGLQTSQNYAYALDGTGIDVIINDSGIQQTHPEFLNDQNQTRVKFVDWNKIASILGLRITPNPSISPTKTWNDLSYSDSGNLELGHGTHVAGIAAGKTYGWAKNANIYSLYYSTVGKSLADPLDTFEMMLYWHLNKANKNPTVVNMSWSLRILNQPTDYYANITGGSYQGTQILSGQPASYYQQRGLIPLTGGGFPAQGNTIGLPYTSAAYNAALGELIESGITVVRSAGNNSFKIDKPINDGGTGDYDNYITWNRSAGNIYYNRGASPMDPRAIVVGALDTVTSSIGQDQKVFFSCAGPRVDIYAAGTYIISALPNNSPEPGAPYYLNPKFKELIANGTSQAAPQITGMCALYLQSHRPANIYSANNCSNVKSWVITNATTNTFYQTGNATSYTNYLSLLGGQPRVAYQPLQGITYAKNAGWQQVANVYVRGVSSWEPVRSAYTKTNAGWIQIF